MNEIRFNPDQDTIVRLALEASVPGTFSSGIAAELVLEAYVSEVAEGRLVPPQVIHPDLEMRLRGARQTNNQ